MFDFKTGWGYACLERKEEAPRGTKEGIFHGIEFSEDLNRYIFRKCLYVKEGDKIEYFDNASKALGIIFMKFDSKESMNTIMKNINKHISIKLLDNKARGGRIVNKIVLFKGMLEEKRCA